MEPTKAALIAIIEPTDWRVQNGRVLYIKLPSVIIGFPLDGVRPIEGKPVKLTVEVECLP